MRKLLFLVFFLSSSLETTAQSVDSDAVKACQPEDFINQNSLSTVYGGGVRTLTLNAKLGSVASCSLSARLKACLDEFDTRAFAFSSLYPEGLDLYRATNAILRSLESTPWHYKIKSGTFSNTFSEVTFGSTVENELNARYRMMFNGVQVNTSNLQKLFQNVQFLTSLCDLGNMSEDDFSERWRNEVIKFNEEETRRAKESQTDTRSLSPESIAAFVQRIRTCWVIPPGAREANIKVKLKIRFNRDGSLASTPEVLNGPGGKLFSKTARTAIDAVTACQKYDFFPSDQYGAWQELVLNFDPNMFSNP